MDHYFTNNQNLKSEIRTIKYSYAGYELNFFSDNGVFCKDKIDFGSHLLVDTFLKNYHARGNILDVGCGYGFMGITLSKILDTHVTMTDVNKRALHLAKMGIDENKANATLIESYAYENVPDKYDVIITNPPVRAGKKVLLEILEGAKNHLKDDGQLWYVLRKDQGAKSMMEHLKTIYKIEIMEKSKGFYIFCCKIY